MRKCTSVALPTILQEKEKTQSAKLGARLESPSSPQMLRREQRELKCVSFRVTCCSDFDEKSMILGARAALAPVWGRVPKVVAKKTIKARNH